jgi:hypothetical protein
MVTFSNQARPGRKNLIPLREGDSTTTIPIPIANGAVRPGLFNWRGKDLIDPSAASYWRGQLRCLWIENQERARGGEQLKTKRENSLNSKNCLLLMMRDTLAGAQAQQAAKVRDALALGRGGLEPV